MRDCDRVHFDVTACHEAGHLVSALHEGFTVEKAIASRSMPGSGAVHHSVADRPTRFDPSLGAGNARVAWWESVTRTRRRMRVLLAGPLAEAKAMGTPMRSLGAKSDLAECRRLADRLLALWSHFPAYQGFPCPDPWAMLNRERKRVRAWIARPRVWSLVSAYAHALSESEQLDRHSILRILTRHQSGSGQEALDLFPVAGRGDNRPGWDLRQVGRDRDEPMDRETALCMAAWRAKASVDELTIFDGRPENAGVYETWQGECWWIFAPWNDGLLALRSSRIIVIRKSDGLVMCDGPAGDEG